MYIVGYEYQPGIGISLGQPTLPDPTPPGAADDAVTVWPAADFQGTPWKSAGSRRGVRQNDAWRREGPLRYYSGGSYYVPQGFIVRLIGDVNFFRAYRQRETTINAMDGPRAVTGIGHHVNIVAIQDARTPEMLAELEQRRVAERRMEMIRALQATAGIDPEAAHPRWGVFARAVDDGLCEGPPPYWPYLPAPFPAGPGAIGAAQTQGLINSIAPIVKGEIERAQKKQIAAQMSTMVAEFLPPVAKGIFQSIAQMMQPIEDLIHILQGKKEACVNPQVVCPVVNRTPDGRVYGKEGEGINTPETCCMPPWTGMGVGVCRNVLGLGRPDSKPGYVPAVAASIGSRFAQGQRVDAPASVLKYGTPAKIAHTTLDGAGNTPRVGGITYMDDGTWVLVPWNFTIDKAITVESQFSQFLDSIEHPQLMGGMREDFRGHEFGYRAFTLGELRNRVRGKTISATFTRWVMAHRWPGTYEEWAAGDYPNVNTQRVAKPMFIIVPDGWVVRLYRKHNFEGPSVDLGPGAWNVMDVFGDYNSASVRGWWSLYDASIVKKLVDRTSGWATADWPEPPSAGQAVTMVTLDPCRLPPPMQPEIPMPDTYVGAAGIPRPSMWRPGWESRVRALTAIEKSEARREAVKANVKATVHTALNVGKIVLPAAAVLALWYMKRR